MNFYKNKYFGVAFPIFSVLILLIWFAPEDIYYKNSFSAFLLQQGCQYMPFPCVLAARTSLPAMNQTALIFTLISSFLSAPFFIYDFIKGKSFDALWENKKTMWSGWIFLILPFFPFLHTSVSLIPSRLEILLRILSQSRFGLAVFCIFLFCGHISLLLTGAIWLKCLIARKKF